jgi:hypothetical protein
MDVTLVFLWLLFRNVYCIVNEVDSVNTDENYNLCFNFKSAKVYSIKTGKSTIIEHISLKCLDQYGFSYTYACIMRVCVCVCVCV